MDWYFQTFENCQCSLNSLCLCNHQPNALLNLYKKDEKIFKTNTCSQLAIVKILLQVKLKVNLLKVLIISCQTNSYICTFSGRLLCCLTLYNYISIYSQNKYFSTCFLQHQDNINFYLAHKDLL